MAAKMAANFFNFYSRWTRKSPNATLYGLSTAAKSFLKMALQSGPQNPRWLPKWPPKWLLNYLKFTVDGLEDHLGGIKGCTTIPEVGVAIPLPESKMATKMAAKMKQTFKTFSMQYAHLSVDIQLHHIPCIVQWRDSYCWTSLVLDPGMTHKFVLQSGHHNPKWPPKWLLNYLKFNVDGLEDHRVRPARLLDMEEECQEEHPYGEVGRHGACHTRNNGYVGMQVWPANRHARPVRPCYRLLPLRQGNGVRFESTDEQ